MGILGNLQVFFNTRIDTSHELEDPEQFSFLGRHLQRWGDYLLSPVRFFLPGSKTVWVSVSSSNNALRVHHFSKVSSFHYKDMNYVQRRGVEKASKQNDQLRVKDWSEKPKPVTGTVIGAALVFPLGLIFGSIFKAFSYFDPNVRMASSVVKQKLTPKDHQIETPYLANALTLLFVNSNDPTQNPAGQKWGKLTIKCPHDHRTLTAEHLKLIVDLNPKEVVFVGSGWTLAPGVSVKDVIRSARNQEKWKKWGGFEQLGVDVAAEKESGRSIDLNKPEPAKGVFRELVNLKRRMAPLPNLKFYDASERSAVMPTPPVSKSSMFKRQPKHMIRVEQDLTEVRKEYKLSNT